MATLKKRVEALEVTDIKPVDLIIIRKIVDPGQLSQPIKSAVIGNDRYAPSAGETEPVFVARLCKIFEASVRAGKKHLQIIANGAVESFEQQACAL